MHTIRFYSLRKYCSLSRLWYFLRSWKRIVWTHNPCNNIYTWSHHCATHLDGNRWLHLNFVPFLYQIQTSHHTKGSNRQVPVILTPSPQASKSSIIRHRFPGVHHVLCLGAQFWCLIDVTPIRNEKDNVVLFLISHKEISGEQVSSLRLGKYRS